MKKIIVLFYLLSSIALNAQNGGDFCSGAISVASGNFTNVSITQDSQGGEQGTAQPIDSAWYMFTPDEDGLLSVSSCASNTDTRVFIGTGTCGSLITQAQSDDTCGLQSEISNFFVTAGVTYYIEWDDRWSPATFSWSLSFIPSSACQAPAVLTVNNIESTSASLSWDAAADTSTYEWVVMFSGEDPNDTGNTPVASGTTGVGVLMTQVTGLESNQSYDAFVRAICDTEESVYTDAVTFTTNCEVFIPSYTETFDGGIVPPMCWLEASNGTPAEGPMNLGAGAWRADDYLNDEVLSGGMDNAARINLFFNLEQDWLISPSFDLTGGTYELAYNVAVTDFGNQDPSDMGSDDEVRVLISTDNGDSWNTLLTYNTSNTPSNIGQEEIIDLSAFTGTAIFAFWGTDGTVNDLEDYDFFIDEFQVRSPLSCTAPEVVYTEIPDCDNDQFSIEVEIVSLGSAVSLIISDDFGSDDEMIDTDGGSVILGPYPSGTAVLITITGDDDDCTVNQNIQYSCPPPNNVCPEAMALITGVDFPDQAIITTNVDATDSGAITPTCANYDGGDVWFTAVVPDDGILTIETNAADGSLVEDTGMEVYMGSCEALVLIECDDDDSEDGLFSLITINDIALAGETIFIRAWEWSNDAFGEFQISAYNEDFEMPCVAPDITTSIATMCNDGTYSISVLLNSLGSAPSVVIADDQGSDPQTISADDTEIILGPYNSGQEVEISITGDDDECTIIEVVSFTCPPDNDFCQTAIPLITGVDFPAEAITVTNEGATDSQEPFPSCADYNGGDVWFSATVPPSGLLNIETNSAAGSPLTDTAIGVYSGNCEALTFIACDDDSSEDGAFSLVTLTNPDLGGETIFIRVYNPPNDTIGDFQISVYNENILGVNSTATGDLSLFPNPAQNEVTITNLPVTATVFVTNMFGQKVLEGLTSIISVKDLQAGIYFVTIQEAFTSQTLQFIKK